MTAVTTLDLGADDLGAVLEIATELAADALPSFERVLEMLRSVIECKIASFNDMTLATSDYRTVTAPAEYDSLSHELKPAYDRYAHQHPLISLAGRSLAGSALRFCDAPGGDRLTETELFTHFYEPFGLRFQLIVQLPSPPDVVVGYALSRAERAGEFSDRDVEVLNALGPHLAMHHRTVVNQERSGTLGLEAARSGWTAVSVRSDGVVAGSSSGAGDARLAVGQRVPAPVASLLPSGNDIETAASIEEVDVAGEVWRCVVRPMRAGPTMLLVRIVGNEPRGASTMVDVGLTPRQIEVAMELAATGGTNVQLARRLGITEGTVKKHLETVFAVLGVESRAAAIVALGELAAS